MIFRNADVTPVYNVKINLSLLITQRSDSNDIIKENKGIQKECCFSMVIQYVMKIPVYTTWH